MDFNGQKNKITSNFMQKISNKEIDSDIEIESEIGPILNFKFGEKSKYIEDKKLRQTNETNANIFSKDIAKPNLRYLAFDEFKKSKINSELPSIQNHEDKQLNNANNIDIQLNNKFCRTNSREKRNSIDKLQTNLLNKNINNSFRKPNSKRQFLFLSSGVESEYLRACSFSPNIIRSPSYQKCSFAKDILNSLSQKDHCKFNKKYQKEVNLNNLITRNSSISAKANIMQNNKKKGYLKFIQKLSSLTNNSLKYVEKYNQKFLINKKVLQEQNFINNCFSNKFRKEVNQRKKIIRNKEYQCKILEKNSKLINNNEFFLSKKIIDKDIKACLLNIKIDKEELTKPQLFTLLSKLSFISCEMIEKDENLINEFWRICSGRTQEKAKISNIKLLLYSIIGIINPIIFEEIKQSKLKKNKLILVSNNSFESQQNLDDPNMKLKLKSKLKDEKQIYLTKNNSVEINNSLEDEKEFTYDECDNLLLSLKNLPYLRKQFIPLCCKRLSGKEKIETATNLYCKNKNTENKRKELFDLKNSQSSLNLQTHKKISNRNHKDNNIFFINNCRSKININLNQKIRQMQPLKHLKHLKHLKQKEISKNSQNIEIMNNDNYIQSAENIQNIKENPKSEEMKIFSSQKKDYSTKKTFKRKAESKQSETEYIKRIIHQTNSSCLSIQSKGSISNIKIIENQEREIKDLEKIEEIVKQQNNNLISHNNVFNKNESENKNNQINSRNSRNQKFQNEENLQKFKDDFKVIRESDKMISKLINIYAANIAELNESLCNSNSNSSNSIDSENLLINSPRNFNRTENSGISLKISKRDNSKQINTVTQDIETIYKTERNKRITITEESPTRVNNNKTRIDSSCVSKS